MKYIKSIEIINFQSHKNSYLSFENGLNVISGPSDNGKSAIIRALKWVLYNEPKGTDFIRQGETSCKVSIVLSNDKTIIRERTKSKNQYRIIDENGVEAVFEGFGNEIPEEVLETHGISRLYVDSSSAQSINLSEQLEGPFLLSQPGSVKAKAIGRLVGVHIVDDALKEITKELTGCAGEERTLNNNLNYLKEKLKEFEFLHDKKEEIDRKEKILKIILDKNEKLKRLKNLNEAYKGLEANISNTNKILGYLKNLDRADIKLGELGENVKNQTILILNKEKYAFVSREVKEAEAILRKTSNLRISEDIIADIDAKNSSLEKMRAYRNKLNSYVVEINHLTSIVSKLEVIAEVGTRMTGLEEFFERDKKLKNISEALRGVLDRIKKGEEYVNKFREIQIAEAKFKKGSEVLDIFNRLSVSRDKFMEITKNMKEAEREIRHLNESTESDIKDYMVLLKQIGKCPVCMSPIEDHTVDLIINEFKGAQ